MPDNEQQRTRSGGNRGGPDGFTPLERAFVEHYLNPESEGYQNQTRAYMLAAPGKPAYTTAGRNAVNVMRRPHVAQAIAERRVEQAQNVEVTVERVLREYARIAFSDIRRYMRVSADGVAMKDSDQWTEDEAAAVAEVSETRTENGGSIRVKLHSKMDALGALGKHLGMFNERIDIHVIREEARKVAEETGLDPEDLVREAEQWLRSLPKR